LDINPVEVIMARAMAEKRKVEQPANYSASSVIQHQSTCSRCGGLMVSDFCMDVLNSTGELEFAAKRCVQCGEVVDPVILRNRRIGQEVNAPSMNCLVSPYATRNGSTCGILPRPSTV